MTTRELLSLGAVLAAVLALGCGSSVPNDAKQDTPSPTASTEPHDAAAVYLRRHMEGERMIVDVYARGAADVHGAAFRLHWSPDELTFGEARAADVWSRQALLLAKEGVPGELVVAWTEKGAGTAIDAREERRLGTIELTTKKPSNAELAIGFRRDRSMLVDSKGARIGVAWRDTDVASP